MGSQAFEHSYLFCAVRSSDMYISGQALGLKASAVGSVDHYERNERARERARERHWARGFYWGHVSQNTMIEI